MALISNGTPAGLNDLLGYMSLDPIFRGYHHGELTFSMIYAYSEDYMLTFSHDDIVNGKESMIRKMPGRTAQQEFANLRAAYAYMVAHPGKKAPFHGTGVCPGGRLEGGRKSWNGIF